MSKLAFAHIGYPKAASSWIQDNLFENHPEIKVLHNGSKSNPRIRKNLSKIIIDVVYQNGSVNKLISLINSHIQSNNNVDSNYGLSHESLSGQWLIGDNSDKIFKALKEVNSSIKILIIIRNQRDAIVSSYAQYVKHGGTRDFKDFVFKPYKTIYKNFNNNDENILNFFLYKNLIQKANSVFGQDNVFIGLVEELKRDNEKFASSIYDFLKIQSKPLINHHAINKRPNHKELQILRKINTLFISIQNPEGPFKIGSKINYDSNNLLFKISNGIQKKIAYSKVNFKSFNINSKYFDPFDTFSKHEMNELINYYHDHNKNLSKILNKDLNQYGYW